MPAEETPVTGREKQEPVQLPRSDSRASGMDPCRQTDRHQGNPSGHRHCLQGRGMTSGPLRFFLRASSCVRGRNRPPACIPVRLRLPAAPCRLCGAFEALPCLCPSLRASMRWRGCTGFPVPFLRLMALPCRGGAGYGKQEKRGSGISGISAPFPGFRVSVSVPFPVSPSPCPLQALWRLQGLQTCICLPSDSVRWRGCQPHI